MADLVETTPLRSWKYKIEQSSKGARVTVHGDVLDELIIEYQALRRGLERAGFKVAPED